MGQIRGRLHITFAAVYNPTLILGQSNILSSLVTVPTITTILPSLPDFFICLEILAMDTGGLLILDMKRRRRMMRLNLASVRRAKKRYNCNFEWNGMLKFANNLGNNVGPFDASQWGAEINNTLMAFREVSTIVIITLDTGVNHVF